MESLLSYLSPFQWILASFILGAIFFVLGLLGFPFDEGINIKRKLFWSSVMFLAELVLGFMLGLASSIDSNLKSINTKVREDRSVIDTLVKMEPVLSSYERNFTQVQEPLSSWAITLREYLRDQFQDGFIPVPKETAASQLAEAYIYAQSFVVAVNVGSTAFYFGQNAEARSYLSNNVYAMSHGIPVIRFFLYKTGPFIQLSNGRRAHDFDEFVKDIRMHVAPETGAIYSAVIDITDNPLVSDTDILFIDGKFLAESIIADDWSILRARATSEPRHLEGVPGYLKDLVARADVDNVVKMSDLDIKTRYRPLFTRYATWVPPQGQELSDCIYQDVLKSAGAQLSTSCSQP